MQAASTFLVQRVHATKRLVLPAVEFPHLPQHDLPPPPHTHTHYQYRNVPAVCDRSGFLRPCVDPLGRTCVGGCTGTASDIGTSCGSRLIRGRPAGSTRAARTCDEGEGTVTSERRDRHVQWERPSRQRGEIVTSERRDRHV